ncbi:phosphoenolpyruvate mutase [Serratia entomophila]|uniref:phosphoenolpyruvate mutase n=1 Tax=Serratia entomophila TaxID=42906 RepID=UPI00217CC1A3|nr:phosphoenolpyruvate mutase [Serratia entomophila]CAI1164449.1 Phosphonopyruvate hydrolase [Serratia entomophila]CAI1735289.1 Phosphonopyruvate hydrolase [Serratia entomophila]CAI1901846.1 Phosphonopyruvate hydrolase [Serratia entomophila]CAI1907570.1 Phosphonopyruvate hydrolase [Serratia entomophila]CAI1994178.1 Phosphonopyruvate hydrolase [Serratia entomophila]
MSTKKTNGKNQRLRAMIASPELSFLMESHNALSAKIAEQAGFSGLWASGLTISAALGLSDRNEASWTQVLDVVEFMTDHVDVPILLDGDTGFGNYHNVIRLVKKLCQKHVSGVCIEDKIFPKMNSFLGERQRLADIDDFCSKIKAAKDTQFDDDFVIVARTEALISSLGMSEALNRAEHYRRAGADAILIHSKRDNADEILEFAAEWANRSPLVIVPTKYYSTPTDVFRQANISTVIWANHSLRSSIAAMRETTRYIFESQSIIHIEQGIATLEDVFALTNEVNANLADRRYKVGLE